MSRILVDRQIYGASVNLRLDRVERIGLDWWGVHFEWGKCMAVSKTDLEAEWQKLPKNWYAIYQWKRTDSAGYSEWIAEWILSSLPRIQLITDGLRNRSFRVADHRGQIHLNTPIDQDTEKRLVRAMFNSTWLPLLGKVIDYEVPLKNTQHAAHGDIDLLCVMPGICHCVEAKSQRSQDSILKAVLQAYTYTSLVSSERQSFLSSFEIDSVTTLTPAILTFESAQSGRQLKDIGKYPHLLKLIECLNAKLANDKIGPLRFFVVDNPSFELKNCLVTMQEDNGDTKVVFREGFTLSIVERTLP